MDPLYPPAGTAPLISLPLALKHQSSPCEVVFTPSDFCLSPDATDDAVIGVILAAYCSVAVTTVTLPTGLMSLGDREMICTDVTDSVDYLKILSG